MRRVSPCPGVPARFAPRSYPLGPALTQAPRTLRAGPAAGLHERSPPGWPRASPPPLPTPCTEPNEHRLAKETHTMVTRWLPNTALILAFLLAAAPAFADVAESPGSPAAPPEDLMLEAPGADAAPADDAPALGFEADLTWNSKYVWRGIEVTEDPVLQPSLTLSYGGLSLNVWANLDTTDVNDFRWQANEVDYTLDYTFEVDILSVSVGAIHYAFPEAHVFDTTEIYLGLGLDVPTAPSLTVYQDLDEHDGTYLLLAFGHAFEDLWQPTEGVSVSAELGASFAWGSRKHNQFYYGAGAGWADATLSLGMPIAIGDHLTITPAVTNSWILDDDISRALGEDSVFWGGVSVTLSW